MEALPLIFVLWFTGLVLTGQDALLVLDPPTILLMLLGLHWWAMGAMRFQRAGAAETRVKIVYLVGLCLALALVIGTHLPVIAEPLNLFLTMLIVLWCWQRGVKRTRANRRAEQMKSLFQRTFFVMLALVVLIALVPSLAANLLAPLTLSFPLFCLSGLVLLSLLRLKTTGQAYQRRFAHDRRADPTRLWFVPLTLFWTGVVGLALLSVTVAFPLVLALLAPLLAPLATALRNLNAFLDALLQKKPGGPLIIHKLIKLRKLPPELPFHNPVLVVILTLVALGVMGLLVVIVIRIWSSNYHYTREDEIREGIAPDTVRNERQQKRASSARQQLDPTSARAQYRKFLLLMARQGTDLERFPHETPYEYQQRLQALLQSFTHEQQANFPAAILDELTEAYIQERYGGNRQDYHPSVYWQINIRELVKRFRRRFRKRDHLSSEEV